jgi:hypothetical protein
MQDHDEYAKLRKHFAMGYPQGKKMYGDIDPRNVEFQTSSFSRSGMCIAEINAVRGLSIIIQGDVGRQYINSIARKLSGSNKIESQKSLEDEIKLSDKLEDFFGREGYIQIFFDKDQVHALSSAEKKYVVIKESTNPEVIKLQDELNPDKLYRVFKYKPRIRHFDKEGVSKMIESPQISKAEKKYLVFNLDQVEDDGQIDLDFKELIYNRFVKGDE